MVDGKLIGTEYITEYIPQEKFSTLYLKCSRIAFKNNLRHSRY
jgi:hypothetical protein